jgi:hypothetical protein
VKKLPALPNERLMNGNEYVSAKEEIQSAETAADTPSERSRFGKISEIYTQVNGANVIA